LVRKLLRPESAGGILLVGAAALALILDNSPLAWLYDQLLQVPFAVSLGTLALEKPLLLWINDGLMAIFFLLVGLEIKREIIEGELSSRAKAALPVFAAIGGMAVPALVFLGLNHGSPETLRGWAIPAATDIAFALGILSLLGPRVPVSLKVFLTAVAIIDDLGAIVIIALFYTADLSWVSIALAVVCAIALALLNLGGTRRIAPYVLIGGVLWLCVLKSGVHATLAGVVVALAIPLKSRSGNGSPLKNLEHALHPWVAFLIMPVFAFANAGVSLKGISFADLLRPLPLGIALGLLVGKQVGVFGMTWLTTRLGLATKPADVSWTQVYGAALLAGIGFTMSLFIGTLAFDGPSAAADVRIGVLSGSLVAGLCGFLLLRFASPVRRGLHPRRP